MAVIEISDSEDEGPRQETFAIPVKRRITFKRGSKVERNNLNNQAVTDGSHPAERPPKRPRVETFTAEKECHVSLEKGPTKSHQNALKQTKNLHARSQSDGLAINRVKIIPKVNPYVDSAKAKASHLLPPGNAVNRMLAMSWTYLGRDLQRLRRPRHFQFNPPLSDLIESENSRKFQRKRKQRTDERSCTTTENGDDSVSLSVASTPTSIGRSRSNSLSIVPVLNLDGQQKNFLPDLPRPQRKLKVQKPAHYSQTGPEQPSEFNRLLHERMNRPDADRTSRSRAEIFEAYLAEQTSREEPDAPPIRVISHRKEACPELNFVYTSRIVYQPGTRTLQNFGCSCIGGCKAGDAACSCYARQCAENARHDIGPGFAYSRKGLLKFQHDQPAAIWECNDSCGCPPDCGNRRVGRGRQIPIDLVRTPNCGWGKLPHHKNGGSIKAGTFVGVYSGELVPTHEARRRDQLYNAINLSYLFDLDFVSIGKHEALKKFDDDGICLISSTIAPELSQDPTATSPDAMMMKPRKEEFNTFNAFHSVDAFHYGGITRFLNHNCQPNCLLRCCYVNEADPTKPLLAIFTLRKVKPGEELTISYSGDLGMDVDLPLNMPKSVAVAKGKVKATRAKTKAEKAEDEALHYVLGGCFVTKQTRKAKPRLYLRV